MQRGNSESVIHLFSGGIPYDRGNLDSMLRRANALLQANHATEAMEEFRRLVDLRNGFPADPAGALAILGLARAQAALGDTDSARSRYRGFMALWKDADSTLPVLKQAKNESSALH